MIEKKLTTKHPKNVKQLKKYKWICVDLTVRKVNNIYAFKKSVKKTEKIINGSLDIFFFFVKNITKLKKV